MGLNLEMSDSELEVLVSRALRTRQQAHKARTGEGVRAHRGNAGNKDFKGLDPVTRRKKFDELTPIAVKNNELLELPESYNAREQNKNAVKKAVERNVAGEVENAISREKIIISKRGIENALNHGATPLKIQIVGVLNKLLKTAIPVHVAPNPKNDLILDHYFASKVSFENEDYLVSMVAHEDANGNRFYDHEMMEMEKLDTLMSQSGAASNDAGHTRRYQASVNNIVANALFVNSGIRAHRGPGYYANRPDAATRRRLAIQKALKRAREIKQRQEEHAQPGQHERQTVTRAAYDENGNRQVERSSQMKVDRFRQFG